MMMVIIVTVLASASAAQAIGAATVPSWIKNNADLWVQGQISDDVFADGIGYLIGQGVMNVSAVPDADHAQQEIPEWVKNTAGFWARGEIGDDVFLGAMEYLVQTGIIPVGMQEGDDSVQEDAEEARLEADLAACEDIVQAAKRSDCRKEAQHALTVYQYKAEAQMIPAGPVNFYWNGMGSDGNEFEISSTGQAILSIRMLAENTDSENIALQCTSPQVCSYDVWNGETAFKYAGMDFTNGQIVLMPGQAKEFNMLFGPNIGYGGTQFVYDPSKEYSFRISESWGSAEVSLGLE